MKTAFLQKVSSGLSRTAFKLKKASPELLIVGGVIGVVGAAIGACCATRKLDPIIESHKADIQQIRALEAKEDAPEYSSKDAQHDITITYAKTTWKIVKLYAPAAIVGMASLGCIVASNHILRKRNAAAVAAYAAVDGAFKHYRKNVVERFGEEVDKELRFNAQKQKIEVEEQDENGKVKKVKREVEVQNSGVCPGYARCFDETNKHYKAVPQLNKYFITSIQKTCNEILWARGYIFLNEVYEALGFEKTQAGQRVGWLRDGDGDGEVNFGIFSVNLERNKDFLLGYEPAVWLDFNVDGIIDDKIFPKY